MVITCGDGYSRVSLGTAGISTLPGMPSVGTPNLVVVVAMVVVGVQVKEGSVFNVNLLEITAVRCLMIFPRLDSTIYLDGGYERAKVNARTKCVPHPLTIVVFGHFHIFHSGFLFFFSILF
uniref:Uncharacterized protein n=1 Tax=Schizaphis graminum TaxID=13262 RepID=A0A2S2P242_SCHGA